MRAFRSVWLSSTSCWLATRFLVLLISAICLVEAQIISRKCAFFSFPSGHVHVFMHHGMAIEIEKLNSLHSSGMESFLLCSTFFSYAHFSRVFFLVRSSDQGLFYFESSLWFLLRLPLFRFTIRERLFQKRIFCVRYSQKYRKTENFVNFCRLCSGFGWVESIRQEIKCIKLRRISSKWPIEAESGWMIPWKRITREERKEKEQRQRENGEGDWKAARMCYVGDKSQTQWKKIGR